MNINSLNPNLSIDKQNISAIQQNNKSKEFATILEKASKEKDEKALHKAAEDFESVFIKMMLDSMRKTIDKNGLIPKSHGEEIFESMLDQTYAERLANAGGIGLADMMYKELSQDKQ